VNAVVPGWMMGPAVEIYVQMTSAARNISEEAVLAELTERIPVGHIPTDDEVAGTIVYLASDLSASLTVRRSTPTAAKSSTECAESSAPARSGRLGRC